MGQVKKGRREDTEISLMEVNRKIEQIWKESRE